MSAVGTVLGRIHGNNLDFLVARCGVSAARIKATVDGGTLSAPEWRDIQAAITALGLSIPQGELTAAAAESAGVPHPTARFRSRGDDLGPAQ